MKKNAFFIAGTDTDAGKTFVACKILQAAKTHGLRTLGLKPVTAGAENYNGEWRNDDAVLLQQQSTVSAAYSSVNPFCFPQAIAPHIAAQKNDVSLSAADIAHRIHQTLDQHDMDLAIIEGAGGWRVPLNCNETLADVVKLLQIPVILVVGMKLGCINHALLAAEAILADGLVLHGWIANDLGNPMLCLEENIATLEQWLPAPRLQNYNT